MANIDRVRGSLLGHALGDALGAPFEGRKPEVIAARYATPMRMLFEPPADQLRYTDDAQMAIAIAEVLAVHDDPAPEHYAASYVENFEVWRGYGGGAKKTLRALSEGSSVHDAARVAFPDGSYGNGAAMRVAAVGLRFANDRAVMREHARRSALPTHCHPIGIDGALLIAAGTAFALRTAGRPFDRDRLWEELGGLAESQEFEAKIDKARSVTDPMELPALGTGIAAHESAVTALALLALFPDDYPGAVSHAVCMGGDCDTVAAMAGGLVGARVGDAALPEIWLERLEDGPKGRTYIGDLAARLAARSA